MKKYLITALIALSAFTMISCEGTYTVTARSEQPYYSRPVSPGVDYVWVDGDWRYRGGRYTWNEGYWSHPRRARVWVGGGWESRNRGWYWRRGHWQ